MGNLTRASPEWVIIGDDRPSGEAAFNAAKVSPSRMSASCQTSETPAGFLSVRVGDVDSTGYRGRLRSLNGLSVSRRELFAV